MKYGHLELPQFTGDFFFSQNNAGELFRRANSQTSQPPVIIPREALTNS